jgi:hypothetical protein
MYIYAYSVADSGPGDPEQGGGIGESRRHVQGQVGLPIQEDIRFVQHTHLHVYFLFL